jgi:hypothetical protein
MTCPRHQHRGCVAPSVQLKGRDQKGMWHTRLGVSLSDPLIGGGLPVVFPAHLAPGRTGQSHVFHISTAFLGSATNLYGSGQEILYLQYMRVFRDLEHGAVCNGPTSRTVSKQGALLGTRLPAHTFYLLSIRVFSRQSTKDDLTVRRKAGVSGLMNLLGKLC